MRAVVLYGWQHQLHVLPSCVACIAHSCMQVSNKPTARQHRQARTSNMVAVWLNRQWYARLLNCSAGCLSCMGWHICTMAHRAELLQTLSFDTHIPTCLTVQEMMHCRQCCHESHQQEYTSLSHVVEATCLASYSAQTPAQTMASTLLSLQQPMIRTCTAVEGMRLPAHLIILHVEMRLLIWGCFRRCQTMCL